LKNVELEENTRVTKMEEVDILLTDEYVEFATVVANAHKSKKLRQADFKEIYDDFKVHSDTRQAEIEDLEKQLEEKKATQSEHETEFKKVYTEFKKEVASLDAKVKEAQTKFEEWKAGVGAQSEEKQEEEESK
jgi:predicted nuclease with TOPRIM domain